MGYLDVYKHVRDVKIDRIVLDELTEDWAASTGTTAEAVTTFKTMNDNSIEITSLGSGDIVYKELTDPMNLDDMELIHIHLKSSVSLDSGDLSVILSDSLNLSTEIEVSTVPDIAANETKSIKIEITAGSGTLSSIKSIGLKANIDLSAATIHLGAIECVNTNYVITKEKLEEFETVGLGFVLSKIDQDTLPTGNSRLQEAVYLAGGAHTWMWVVENDLHSWDYGGKSSTQNYGIRLLTEAERRCEEYLFGGDTGMSTLGNKRINILGGYSEMKR